MAVKAYLNLNIGVDKYGNTVYATIYPKTTADQVQGLNEAIMNELIDLPIATKDTKGLVIIGDNITIDENNKISITADDVKRALNYTPAVASSDNNIASEADKLAKPVSIQGVNFDGSTNINNYAVCETAADEQIKKVQLINFMPEPGAELIIHFINGNNHIRPLLQVNEDLICPILYNSNPFVNIHENHIYHFVFNDSKYHLINEPYMGLVI